MELASKTKFFTGITILTLLIISYFIKINVESGSNYEVQDSLLGIIILHNPIVLSICIIIPLVLIFLRIKKSKLLK